MHHHDRYEIPLEEKKKSKYKIYWNFTSRLCKYSLSRFAYFSKRFNGNDRFLINCIYEWLVSFVEAIFDKIVNIRSLFYIEKINKSKDEIMFTYYDWAKKVF